MMNIIDLIRAPLATALLVVPLSLAACADDATGEAGTAGDGDGDSETASSAESGESAGDGDGDPTTGDGDGDGDPTTGDGDGDPTTGDGDGDGDPTTGDGDGDGDPTGDGDGDPTGDGDGDPTGDGDGDPGCDPMDAVNGPEECFNPRGWFWDGQTCEQIICTCEGDDCNSLYVDQAACEDAYGDCPVEPPDCAPDQALGVGPCDLFWGYAWDGEACVAVNGCNCDGPDCDNLWQEPADCEAAHMGC